MRRRLRVERRIGTAPDLCWATITDPARLERLSSAILGARILEREMDIQIVQVDLVDRAAPLVLEVVGSGKRHLRFAQVDRFAGRGVTGSLQLTPSDDGTLVSFEVIVPAPLFRSLRHVREHLNAAIDAVALNIRGDFEKHDVVLRIEPEDSGLVVTIDGRRFRLVPEDTR